MKNIVFIWEFGGGLGHIIPHLDLIHYLKQEGHEIFWIVKDVNKVNKYLNGLDINVFQAPVINWKPKRLFKNPVSFLQILYNIGFNNVEGIINILRTWSDLFELLKPDVAIFDYSPFALLASKKFSFKKIIINEGFLVPPNKSPIPLTEPFENEKVKTNELEEYLLELVNKAANQFKIDNLKSISEIFYSDNPIIFLQSFPDLDPYAVYRENPLYIGVNFDSCHFSNYNITYKRNFDVFAYLKNHPVSFQLIKLIRDLDIPSLVVLEDFKEYILYKNLMITGYPVPLNDVIDKCKLAVLNGSFSTSASFLISGKPVFNIPFTTVGIVTSYLIAKTGAGDWCIFSNNDIKKRFLNFIKKLEEFKINAEKLKNKLAEIQENNKILPELIDEAL